MKRNLLSIVILVLLLVNTILTVLLMVSVVGTVKKTSNLIDGISEALNLEMESQNGNSGTNIPMTSIAVYTIPDSMTVPLQDSGDGKPHYCMLEVSLSLNMESEGYTTYGSDLSAQASLIKDEVYSVVSQYTMEDAKNGQDQIKQSILERLQAMYDSDFIFNVSFGTFLFQ